MNITKQFQYISAIGAVVMLAAGYNPETWQHWFSSAYVAVGFVIE